MSMLSADERQRLRAHGLVEFAGRLILQAQPAISDEQLAEVERRLGRPLPPTLVDLWRHAYGGRLDYDLRVDYQGHLHCYSLRELFYPGSDGYYDLWGWLEQEQEGAREFAEERGEAWNGLLDYLPIGGFEYLERLYICVAPGANFGAVHAWSRGLPPAWTMQLHQDSFCRVADDLQALFAQLNFEQDPLADDAEDSGLELLEALLPLEEGDEVDQALAAKLKASMATQVLDWQAALADGSLISRRDLQCLALEHAVASGDLDLLARLEAAGIELAQLIRGGVNAPVYARLCKKEAVQDWFAQRSITERDLAQ